MRAFILVALLAAVPARAELYRWIDPDTGSVKFSTLPPADPRARAEIVPYKGPAATPPVAPAAGAATPTLAQPANAGASALEGRWSELLSKLTGLSPQDVSRGGEGLRQHVEAYEAVSKELDRMDPAGAARRRAQSESMFDRLKKGLAAQFGPKPSVPQK